MRRRRRSRRSQGAAAVTVTVFACAVRLLLRPRPHDPSLRVEIAVVEVPAEAALLGTAQRWRQRWRLPPTLQRVVVVASGGRGEGDGAGPRGGRRWRRRRRWWGWGAAVCLACGALSVRHSDARGGGRREGRRLQGQAICPTLPTNPSRRACPAAEVPPPPRDVALRGRGGKAGVVLGGEGLWWRRGWRRRRRDGRRADRRGRRWHAGAAPVKAALTAVRGGVKRLLAGGTGSALRSSRRRREVVCELVRRDQRRRRWRRRRERGGAGAVSGRERRALLAASGELGVARRWWWRRCCAVARYARAEVAAVAVCQRNAVARAATAAALRRRRGRGREGHAIGSRFGGRRVPWRTRCRVPSPRLGNGSGQFGRGARRGLWRRRWWWRESSAAASGGRRQRGASTVPCVGPARPRVEHRARCGGRVVATGTRRGGAWVGWRAVGAVETSAGSVYRCVARPRRGAASQSRRSGHAASGGGPCDAVRVAKRLYLARQLVVVGLCDGCVDGVRPRV